MARDLEAWRAPPIPPDISVARVDDASAFHEWCAVFVAGMEVPADGMPAFAQRFADISIGEQSPLRAYLASKQGQPIASGFSVLHDDVVGIYAVATPRRQGAGRAITVRMMDDARREGANLAILESSEMGLPLYESLGLKTACQITPRRRHPDIMRRLLSATAGRPETATPPADLDSVPEWS